MNPFSVINSQFEEISKTVGVPMD